MVVSCDVSLFGSSLCANGPNPNPLLSHLLHTGAVEDLVIVSERQLVKGMSRVVAVTGQEAAQVSDHMMV